MGVLLRKGLLFGDRSPFLYTRAHRYRVPGRNRKDRRPAVGEPYGTDATRKPDVSDFPYRVAEIRDTRREIGVDRTTTYANAPTSVAKRDRGAIRSSPPRRWVGSPRCAVGFRAWSWRPRAGVCLRIPPVV